MPATFRIAVSIAATLLVGRAALAHTVTVDGSTAEWSARTPPGGNLGLVARTTGGAGELIWADATGDERTDLPSHADYDLTGLQVTGSPAGLYFLIRRSGTGSTTGDGALQVQIALDWVVGAGARDFAGFPETQVAGGDWDRLVVTRFGSANPPIVYDLYWTAAPATASFGAGGAILEIGVPWSSLGLTGPPATPVNVWVASFSSTPTDDAVDLGGASVSDAFDVVTDYGDPVAAAYPNTWTEVSDGAINYRLELWFGPTGEVYSPVLIDRFVAASPASPGGPGEWITVRNVAPIPLGGYRLGDSAVVDSAEGMWSLPGVAIAPGATITWARDPAAYAAYFGGPPGGGYADPVNNMSALPSWSPGGAGISLDDAGDEIVLLNGSHTIVDVMPYGSGSFGGIASWAPAPAESRILSRRGPIDTDSLLDWADPVRQCDTSAACGPCRTCAAGACVPAPGTPCDLDSNLCTADVCDTDGTCMAGTALDCGDGNACTADACAPASGCSHAPVTCDDLSACTADACHPGSGCTYTPISCDDGNVCTDDSCNALSGCAFTENTSTCDDGSACTGADRCSRGTCSGTPLACDDGNGCTDDGCDPATGCTASHSAAGTPCADGDACNGAELCDGLGSCSPGTPLDCDDANGCTADACSPATGCAHVAQTGSPCLDGNACNGAEACSAAGTCDPGAPLACDDADACTAETCDPVDGCRHAVVSCDDADACTADACDPASGCTHATVSCDDGNACTADACDPATGCANVALTDGTTCIGSACSAGATCQAGTCTCTPPVDPPPEEPGGCGCRTGSPGSGGLLALLGIALLAPRRPRRAPSGS